MYMEFGVKLCQKKDKPPTRFQRLRPWQGVTLVGTGCDLGTGCDRGRV